jgi:DNA helicase-2/ATP-dependent DNA helicase PcrA
LGSRVREEAPVYAYEDEDQSRSSGDLGIGTRVRHEKFGSGTILSLEPVEGDVKLVVRFASVGVKRLLARYANLQVI